MPNPDRFPLEVVTTPSPPLTPPIKAKSTFALTGDCERDRRSITWHDWVKNPPGLREATAGLASTTQPPHLSELVQKTAIALRAVARIKMLTHRTQAVRFSHFSYSSQIQEPLGAGDTTNGYLFQGHHPLH